MPCQVSNPDVPSPGQRVLRRDDKHYFIVMPWEYLHLAADEMPPDKPEIILIPDQALFYLTSIFYLKVDFNLRITALESGDELGHKVHAGCRARSDSQRPALKSLDIFDYSTRVIKSC